MKQIVFILICLLSVSCMTVQRIERNCDEFAKICIAENTDTVRIENTIVVTERDTVVYFTFPRDTMYVEIPVKIPPKVNKGLVNSKLSYLEAGYAWSTAQVEKGVLKHYIESRDTIIQIQLDNAVKTIKQLRTELKSSQKYITVKENTKFADFTIRYFWYSLIVIILILGWLVLKNKAKLIGVAKKLF